MAKKSVLDNAICLTSEVFNNIEIDKYKYKEYELIWSIYNIVHMNYSIPYFRDGSLPIVKKRTELSRKRILTKIVIQDFFLVLYSLISMMYLKIRYKKVIAIWTGDFYDEKLKGDFRLGKLYTELNREKIAYVDFIRDNNSGYKAAIKNIFKRKRAAVYYSSMERFFTFYQSFKNDIYLKKENKLHYNILEQSIKSICQPQKIEVFRKIFNFINIEKLICWEFSDRQANLIIAAKISKIKTIGFMHGAGLRNYMANEFISEFNCKKRIGPDIMGVWSKWWKTYYENNSKIYSKIEVCGTIKKPVSQKKSNMMMQKIKKVLWISEPLIDPEEVITYMRFFKDNFEFVIKKRPYTNDIFYNKLISRYDSEFKNIKTIDGDIYDAALEYDLIVGSHSTAVIDASRVNKPLLFVDTNTWGNYFDVEQDIFVSDIEKVKEKISNIDIDKIKDIKNKYFGKDEHNGVEWIIKKIKN